MALGLLANTAYATEFETRSDEVREEIEKTATSFKKDKRFVVVPIPLSNPTIGSGLALGGIYLHQKKDDEKDSPISVSGMGSFYTDTDSWGVGIFHDGSYAHDMFRLRAGFFYGELNLKFYGIGEDSILRDHPIDFSSKSTAFAPQVLFEMPWHKWFWGVKYVFINLDTEFDLSSLLPILPGINVSTKTAGLGLVAMYDGRDSNLWPLDGSYFEGAVSDYGDYLGGDFSYEKIKVQFSQFFPLTETISWAYRLDGQVLTGDPPFYDLSQPKVHGIPGGKYADKNAISGQLQARWRFLDRWNAIFFGGGGRIADEINGLDDNTTHYAGGCGVRYIINLQDRLSVGIDITQADDETGIYVMIGDIFAR